MLSPVFKIGISPVLDWIITVLVACFDRLMGNQRRKQSPSLLMRFWQTQPGLFLPRRNLLNLWRIADMCRWSQHLQGLFSWETCNQLSPKCFLLQIHLHLQHHPLAVQPQDSKVQHQPWQLMRNPSLHSLLSTPRNSGNFSCGLCSGVRSVNFFISSYISMFWGAGEGECGS